MYAQQRRLKCYGVNRFDEIRINACAQAGNTKLAFVARCAHHDADMQPVEFTTNLESIAIGQVDVDYKQFRFIGERLARLCQRWCAVHLKSHPGQVGGQLNTERRIVFDKQYRWFHETWVDKETSSGRRSEKAVPQPCDEVQSILPP